MNTREMTTTTPRAIRKDASSSKKRTPIGYYSNAISLSSAIPLPPPETITFQDISIDDFSQYLRDVEVHFDTYRSNRSENAATGDGGRIDEHDTIGKHESGVRGTAWRQKVLRLEQEKLLKNVPADYFCDDFDLTRPEMFRKIVRVEKHRHVGVKEEKSEPKKIANARVEADEGKRATRQGGTTLSDPDASAASSSSSSSTAASSPPRKHDETEAELHERLTGYLDTVEVCLLRQISDKSDAFFGALQNLQDFRTEVANACERIAYLRRLVRLMKENMAIAILRVPRLCLKRRNIVKLRSVVALMCEVKRTKTTIQALLEGEDYSGASDVITRTQSVLREELAGLRGLKHVSRQLQKFQQLIATTMSARFLDVCITLELKNRTDDEEEEKPEEDGGGGSFFWVFKEKMTPLVRGLIRAGHLQHSVAQYRTRLSELVTSVVKTAVAAALEDAAMSSSSSSSSRTAAGGDIPSKAPSVVTQLRTLNPEGFLQLLELVLEHVNVVVSRATAVHRTLLAVIEDCYAIEYDANAVGDGAANENGDEERNRRASSSPTPHGHRRRRPPPPRPPPSSASSSSSASRLKAKLQRESCKRDSREALEHVWKLAQRHVSRMFQLRRDVHEQLTLEEAGELWSTVSAFVEQIEKNVGRRGDVLTGTLQQQMELQLQHMHVEQMKNVTDALNGESWEPASATMSDQGLLRVLATSATSAQRAVARAAAIVVSHEGGENTTDDDDADDHLENEKRSVLESVRSAVHAATVDAKRAAKRRGGVRSSSSAFTALRFKSQKYRTIGTVSLVLRSIVTYILGCAQCPMLSSHALRRVLDLLRLFNTKSTQLVLGAGALLASKGRVKQITAQHLALLSQGLSLVIAVLPCLRDVTSIYLDARQHLLLANMDRMAKAFDEHREKIFAKLVAILQGVVDSNCRDLSKRNWEATTGGGGSDDKSGGDEKIKSPAAISAVPGRYMVNIVRGLSQLHKLLAQTLPPSQLQDVFKRIVVMLNKRLPFHFSSIDASSVTTRGTEQILTDVGHLVSALRKVRGLRDRGRTLDRYFRDKYVLCLI
eukprot:g727.t1